MQIKDIVGKIKYETKAGEKMMWINAGKLYIKDDGTFSVKINRWINPMAFANEKGECYFNVFDIKKKATTEQATAEQTPIQTPMTDEIISRTASNIEEEVPF